MMKTAPAEAASLAGNGERLENLGMYTRTKESIRGIGDIFRGAYGMVTGKGGRWNGLMTTVGGFGNAIDAPVTAAYETFRPLVGSVRHGISDSRFNLGRALDPSNVQKPRNLLASVGDTIHALTTRLGKDITAALKTNQSGAAVATTT